MRVLSRLFYKTLILDAEMLLPTPNFDTARHNILIRRSRFAPSMEWHLFIQPHLTVLIPLEVVCQLNFVTVVSS